MKKHILTILLVMLGLVTFGQQWTAISGNTPSKYQVALVASSERNITVDLQLSGFFTSEVTTPQGQACIVSLPKTVSVAAAGEPNLPMIPIPTIIGDRALMGVQVISAEYTDYPNMEIAPSKGDFPRSINPDDVPYTYGEAYRHDAFFPAQLVKLDEPYIHRDVRGQNMMVTPCQYNPITKVLRVYHHLVLSMDKIGYDTRNIIESRNATFVMDPEFKAMYENRYINYETSMSRYTAIEEAGELLVICYDNFMSAMEPFVAWKKQIGRPTTMVGTSTAGSTNTAIKSYITTYYNQHPNLTDVLLVGDVAQIPGVSAGSGSYSGKGDNPYGQVAGSDRYNDVIIGRFCCETAAQVTNHVNKVINYERDLNASATWLSIGQGVSKNEGAGQGHDGGESDYQHIDNIRTDLLNYNYTNVYRDYQSVSGTTASSANVVSQHINEGVSIINYCNHGSETSWGVFSYSNSHVNALTNDYKLPYIISVACLNGKYDYGSGCFAEAWMRATNNSNGNPTGAIGGMFSYISQPWTPPQYGQDEMVDILVESYSNRIRRTMGGVSINGNMAILDLGASSSTNYGTYETWILFGDPTLTLRNAVPQNMGVTHAPTMYTNATSFAVNATNGNGALATLTRNGEIMGSATITNGSCNITFTAPGSTGTATLTVFGYNKITYIADINIVGGSASEYTINVSANPTAGGTVTGGGTFPAGSTRTVTATANTGYTFQNWTENGTVVSTNASYSFTLNYDRNLVANFAAQTFTINATADPTVGGSVSVSGNRDTFTYGFEDGTTQGWTVGSSDNGSTTWTVGQSGNPNQNYTTHGGNYYIGSVYDESNAVDDWLISPQFMLGGTMSFYIKTTSASYTDYYSVLVSTGTNAISQFTTTVVSATRVTSTNYTVVNVNLGSYSGMGYVAIRHTANADQASLLVDDITIVEGEDPGTDSGTFNYGQTCTVTATPNSGYQFVNWTENGTAVSSSATYSFTVTSNRDLVAHFTNQTQSYTIAVSANPTNGGTVTGGGTFSQGQSCTVVAAPNANYTFNNWTENGTVVSTNTSYTFTVNGNRTLVANFTYTPPTYTVAVSANPTNGGTVTGGGTFQQGQSCTVNATANTGYTFTNWTENGTVVSTNAQYTFTVSGNRALVANFTINTYTINVSANPTAGGTVSGGGTFTYGQSCTVNATAATGYTFTNWTENGTVVSTNAHYTFTVNANRNLVAHFTANTYTITVSASPTNGGIVTGGGTFTYGQSCTLTATANSGFTFINWTENGSFVSSNATLTFTVTGNANIVAHFTENPLPMYTITVTPKPAEGGTVSGGGTYQEGQSCAVVATPAPGYTFTNWTENGTVVSTDSRYTFVVTGNRNLNANFTAIDYVISASIDPAEGGIIEGAGTFAYGSEITLKVVLNDSYTFLYWTENGLIVSYDQNYAFTVTNNRTLVANVQHIEGIEEHTGVSFDIYPNPVSDKLTIEASEAIDNIEVFNIAGAMVFSQKNCTEKVEINTTDMPAGTYVIRMTTKNASEVRRFVKF